MAPRALTHASHLMMRFGFLLAGIALLLGMPRLTSAQVADRHGFIGLGIGPSAPLGSFADRSLTNPRAGRAVPGYTSTMLNVSYRHAGRGGVAGTFFYAEYDMDDMEDDDWWQVAGITVGPMYSHPLGARSAIDLKAMFGLLALTPVVDSYTTADRTGSGLGIDLRATVRYDVLRRWAVFAEGGVQYSQVSFSSGTRKGYRAVISGFGFAFRPAW